MEEVFAVFKNVDEIEDWKTAAFEVVNAEFNDGLLQLSEYQQEINKRHADYLKEDIYLEEAYKIMLDLISLKN